MRLWDVGEQAYIDTFFGQKAVINDRDCIGDMKMVRCVYVKR